ncbi:hypothetical protein CMV24_20775 [Pseudomonas plecoglossicida]|jgi:macrodomain Ter protein organizer (MatP/YcbG family)|uniref:Uncharacterized protein n=2 Tax=Pseudomonadaceae TaxID=135621 RepID=A0A2A3M134_PSEDL|nr:MULTISPECIES: hypothetical protein [Pseudomonas]PAO90572.1 hypothetical protein BV581_20165 [Stutzerimonas stutzeri]EKT4562137.1 hypothetical protein [Pseudomonas putida]MBI9205795.1 hypothetical protein [Pseudomonas aeruginosa]MBV6126127.1 hypothetical protein [Pseudomonas aeruginosa]MBX6862778.1 hypothetical protein [Pseudomonas aeruginosa]
MARTEGKPSWLNEDDHEEWQWAANYLSKHCPDRLKDKLSLMAATIFSSLVRSIHALEKEAEGVKLIQRLRNAIRQRRYRATEGGRQTCSFTLPKATKAKLKTLAKRHKITETGVIESLIEVASKQVSINKEEARHESQAMKAIRNARKLEQELAKIRIDETWKQLRHCIKQLAQWEAYLKETLPALSPEEEAAATPLAEEHLRVIQEAIDAAVFKHREMSPRAI